MDRFFKIIKGPGVKRTHLIVGDGAILVGRTKKSDFFIDDKTVSGEHLRIEVEGALVFVENLSKNGTKLDGKPLLQKVSLASGDVLMLGGTQLQFVEGDIHAQEDEDSVVGDDGDADRTRVASGALQEEEEEDSDKTHGQRDDETVMHQGKVGWKARKDEPVEPAGSAWPIAFLVILLIGTATGIWMYPQKARAASGFEIFPDSVHQFSIEYPASWTRTANRQDLIEFTQGMVAQTDGAKVSVWADKSSENEITGLTPGFTTYLEEMQKRWPEMELTDQRRMELNGIGVVLFGFFSGSKQVKGVYALDAETRYVIECSALRSNFSAVESTFNVMLRSFALTSGTPQRFFDFPLPSNAMKEQAMARKDEVVRRIEQDRKAGQLLFATRDVKAEQLHLAVQKYREALQKCMSFAKPHPLYSEIAREMITVNRALNEQVRKHRGDLRRAARVGNNQDAWWAATRLLQTLPDSDDPLNQETREYMKRLTRPGSTRGGVL